MPLVAGRTAAVCAPLTVHSCLEREGRRGEERRGGRGVGGEGRRGWERSVREEEVVGLKQSVGTNCFNAYKSGGCHHSNGMYISSKNLTCRSCCSDNHWIALSSKGRHWSLSLLLHRAAAGVHAKVTPAPAV